MEYNVTFLIDGERKTLILEHVKEEYGVSEQEFWCCWILGEEHVEGEGNTAADAIYNMMNRSEMQRQGYEIHRAIVAIKGTETWYTPMVQVL